MSRRGLPASGSTHVLMVEDSTIDAALIEWELAQAGLHPVTRRVETESEMTAALDESAWDVVICDYRLPAFSAPAALELVTARGIDMPFIVISGSIGEDSAVEMMRSGAHDYLMKDNLARLGPAVERELRDAANRLARRREAELLAESRALYEAAAIHMTDGLMIVDPSDNVVFLNPRMEELKSMPAEEAVGRSLWDVEDHFHAWTLQPDETRRLSKAARDAALAGGTSTFDLRFGGDQPRDLIVFAFPIRGPSGQILGHGRLARDVTREREVERLKDDFLSMVSHELRTPMNGVIAMTDLLLDSNLDADQRECAEIVRDSGNALVAIVNDILDVSHLKAGKLKLEHVELDVRAVLEHVVELQIGPARQKGLELIGLVDRGVPHLLYGDPGRLFQVLSNLVDNAVKFTRQGEVSIRIALAEDVQSAVVLRCEVVDTGIGAAAQTITGLFEPFTQADSSVTRRYGGTGLGLAICKRLVDGWGGEIGAAAEEGVGSTFWFTVRLKKAEAEVAPRLSASMRDLRVLLLDPHVARRAALSELLAGWGMDVEGCGDTESALMAIESACPGSRPKQFAVVLMTSLPDTGEATRLADGSKGLCGRAAPPIVQLTATAHPSPYEAVSAWPMLSSPPRQSQLLELFAALVDRKPGTLPGGTAASGVAAEFSAAPPGSPMNGVRPLLTSEISVFGRTPRLDWPKPPVAGAAPSKKVAENAPRVLVIDDSEVNRRVAERMLARLGYRTESGDSGLVAISLMALGTYAAVLMDCRMPDMDGFSATAEIRRTEGLLRRTPIIAMTANAELGDRERCLAAGMDGYLAKPVQLAEMERVLTQWIAVSAAEPVAVAPVAEGACRDGVLDVDTLAELRALEEPGEVSLLTELCEAFRDSAPGHIQRLNTTLAAGDATAFGDAAHALKGSAATLGATRLRMAAADLERRGRDHNLADAESHLIALEAAYTDALEGLFQEVVRARQELAG